MEEEEEEELVRLVHSELQRPALLPMVCHRYFEKLHSQLIHVRFSIFGQIAADIKLISRSWFKKRLLPVDAYSK